MQNKLYISMIILAFGINANAQTETLKTPVMGTASFGIYGGINFQNINGKDKAGTKLTNSLVPKFHIGINEEIPIAPEFYFQVGLQFISTGTKGSVLYNDGAVTRPVTRVIKMNYLQVPLNFVYKPVVGRGNLILGFGPYLGYCIGGKAKFTGTSPPSDTDLQFVASAPDGNNNLIYFKRLDVGANFFVGYQFVNGLNIILNSQLGLMNINSKTTSKLAEKNTGFGLSLGYRFM